MDGLVIMTGRALPQDLLLLELIPGTPVSLGHPGEGAIGDRLSEPLDASSGQQIRHLSPAGNPRRNRVLHIMAIAQIRNDTPGRADDRRKVRHEALGDRVELRDLRRRTVAAVW